MWIPHPSVSCLTNLKSLCYDFSSIVVRLGLRVMFKECPLVLETRSNVRTRAGSRSGVVSTVRADQVVWVDRVSPFKELEPSRPTPLTPPACLSGVARASSDSASKYRRTSEFIRAADLASDMVEQSHTEVMESGATGMRASASITTSPFPSSAWMSISASAGSASTSSSVTLSGSSSNQTTSHTSSTVKTSESPSSIRVGASTSASRFTSSHTAESSSSLETRSTASPSSSSPTGSSQGSSRPFSSASKSATLTSAPSSGNSQIASVSASRTTPASRSGIMSTSMSPSPLSSSFPLSSNATDLSASSSPTLSPNGSSTAVSSSSAEPSPSWSPSGSMSQLSTPSSSRPITPLSSSETASSSSATPSYTPGPVARVTSIKVINTTTRTTHTPTSSSTGMLRPGGFAGSGFANNTGAIVGVSAVATVALLALAFLVFFRCRRYRSRVSHNESTERILTLARNVSLRRPVDGSEYGSFREKAFYATSGSASPPRDASYDRSSDGHRGGFGSMSRSHGSFDHWDYPIMERPMNPTFDGQPYMSVHDNLQRPEPAAFPAQAYSFANALDGAPEWRSMDPFVHEDDPASLIWSRGPTRSATLVTSGRSSPSEHGVMAYSTAQGSWDAAHGTFQTRTSIPGPREMPELTQKSPKHSSTPPSAFTGVRDDAITGLDDQQTPHGSQADVMSVKSFFKGARRMSTQSIASTVRGPFTRVMDQEEPTTALPFNRSSIVAPANIYSPSLLNPPIELPPQPLLSFPRGVTGHSYDPHQLTLPWPQATLPPASPSTTDNSSMIEGLLHPKLILEVSRQGSQTSFRDNEDYSRPINGLVKNHHLRSTTTIDTHDTAETEDGASTHATGRQVT